MAAALMSSAMIPAIGHAQAPSSSAAPSSGASGASGSAQSGSTPSGQAPQAGQTAQPEQIAPSGPPNPFGASAQPALPNEFGLPGQYGFPSQSGLPGQSTRPGYTGLPGLGGLPGLPSFRTNVAASLQVIYDSNVSRSSSAAAAARGLSASDEIYEPSLSVDLARPLGRQQVFLNGSIGYDFYQHNTDLNRENIDLRGGANLQALSCRGTVAVGYARSQSDLRYVAFALAAQNVASTVSYALSGDCIRSTGFGPTFSVSETETTNSLAIEKTADAHVFSATGGLAYARPVIGQIRVFGSYTRTTYPDRVLSILGLGDGFETSSGGISYFRPIGSRMEASGEVSWQHLTPFTVFEAPFSGLNYSANLAYHLSRRLTLDVGGSDSVSASSIIGASYMHTRSVQGGVTYVASSRLKFELSDSYMDERYAGASVIPGFGLTHERVNTLLGSAALQVGRKITLSLFTQWQQQDANTAAFTYTDYRVGMTAAARF